MKIAVLGNSHVGPLKQAWSRAQKLPGLSSHSVSFFAVGRLGLAQFEVQNGKLTTTEEDFLRQLANTSGGHQEINPSGFDLFILKGLALRFDYSLIRQRFVSIQVAETALDHWIKVTAAFTLYNKLLQITDKPIVISHCPLLAADAPTNVKNGLHPSNSAIRYEHYTAAISRQLKRDHDWAMPQPRDTRADNFTTDPRFSHGSTRLLKPKEEHPKTDFSHMNRDYGYAWWRAFEAYIQGRKEPIES